MNFAWDFVMTALAIEGMFINAVAGLFLAVFLWMTLKP